ncbi:desiccation-related protein PCC13-62 [Striga asiatica]|uniref:Desiccation-related protein PCC13-62 n=1 Tax=Striga asiatica TaxID=4170 RepID=A0A5A7PEV3_STRAF|nr:desiccation-related protein PCC13-62 [Striga asiatica]
MTHSTSAAFVVALAAAFLLHLCCGYPHNNNPSSMYTPNCPPDFELDLVAFPLNLEYLEAEFFLCGALGYGIDTASPGLSNKGPPPIGCKKANLSPYVRDIVTQMAYQEIGHLKAIRQTIQPPNVAFGRPQLDLRSEVFASIMNNAFGGNNNEFNSFDPYANDLNYLIASYVIPYVGLTGYVGALPCILNPIYRRLVAGLLAVESGQDAIIREMLYENAETIVSGSGFYSVANFTQKISELRDKLGGRGHKDEGILVDPKDGAEGMISGNVLAGDVNSVAFDRTPEEILGIVYGSGDMCQHGGFFPQGEYVSFHCFIVFYIFLIMNNDNVLYGITKWEQKGLSLFRVNKKSYKMLNTRGGGRDGRVGDRPPEKRKNVGESSSSRPPFPMLRQMVYRDSEKAIALKTLRRSFNFSSSPAAAPSQPVLTASPAQPLLSSPDHPQFVDREPDAASFDDRRLSTAARCPSTVAGRFFGKTFFTNHLN